MVAISPAFWPRALAYIAVVLTILLCSPSVANAAVLQANKGKESLMKRLRDGVVVDNSRLEMLARATSEEGIRLRDAAQSTGLTCATCQNYASLILGIIRDPKLSNVTEYAVAKACEDQYKENVIGIEACKAVGKVVLNALPKLINKLEERGWDVPFNLCAMLFDNICTHNCCTSRYSPEQVYISLADGKDFSKMRVTWVTLRPANDSDVVYYADGETSSGEVRRVAEPTRTYTFAGWIGTINTAVMTDLKPDTKYFYSVGSSSLNRSQTFYFRTFPSNIGTPERPARIIQIADMAYDSSSDDTVARVTERVRNGEVDLIIHNGDISYADGYMKHWDLFMRKVSPFTAYVPYITVPGNHELYQNFTSYRNRLAMSMPRDESSLRGAMYYYVDLGPARLMMLDSESWIDTADIPEHEVAWARRVLTAQDRKEQPFSLVFHHRPLYCNQRNLNCKEFAYILRAQIESLYLEKKVDMVVAGHVHYYLRSYPLFAGIPVSQSYDNPAAPVYVVNGAAGNREGNRDNGVPDHMYPYTSRAVGYSLMQITSDKVNNSHSITYSFFESASNQRLDTFTITKKMK